MKYLIILAFFVGASFACRNFRQSCSHYPIDNEECCEGWECRVPQGDERREGDGNNTRCMDVRSTTTTEATTTQSTTTEQSCRTLYQSCSNTTQVTEDSCCDRYRCRMPRDGERGDGQGNTRCFYPDNDGGNEDEETTTTTTQAPTTQEPACGRTNEPCINDDECCYDDEDQLFCRELVNGTGVFTCQAEEETTTTEATTTEEPRCRVATETCELENGDNDCCEDLFCTENQTSFLTGQGTCEAQTEPSTTTTTTTTEAPCRNQNEECSILENNCCGDLECTRNGTSLVTGICQARTQSTTTTSTTQAPAECRRRSQRCSNRANSTRSCCNTRQGDNEDLVCKRKDGERRYKCYLRSEPTCKVRDEECRREADCCQYRDEERKICYKENRRERRGTCQQCRQTDETCSSNDDCCGVEGEEVVCHRERRRGQGVCQIQSATTTTERTTTERRTRRTTTQRSTTQRSSTQRSTRRSTQSTTEAPQCKRENERCSNTTECCQERDVELVCQAGILGPLGPSTCQRPSSTTTEGTTTTEEGTSSTLLPNGCSQRGGPCPNKTDEECCEDLKCVSIDGTLYQCGYRGVNGTAIV